MRYTLKDYQADAVGDTLRELASARDFCLWKKYSLLPLCKLDSKFSLK